MKRIRGNIAGGGWFGSGWTIAKREAQSPFSDAPFVYPFLIVVSFKTKGRKATAALDRRCLTEIDDQKGEEEEGCCPYDGRKHLPPVEGVLPRTRRKKKKSERED